MMLFKMIRILIAAIALSCYAGFAADVRVSAVGRGVGHGNVAREQALADALRDAVRKGAGVNVLSITKASNYILDYDRIFSRVFGYIKSYKITKTFIDKAGFFTVEIDAMVGQGVPELNDYMAMRQIIAMKGSPRLLIRCKGDIKKIGESGPMIEGQLREIALNCGFQTLRLAQLNDAESKRAKRDLLSKNSGSAAYREARVRENYDFVIDAVINGEYVGASELYGVTTQRFSLGAELGATTPNGNSIAQVTLPSRETDIAKVFAPGQAARAALMQYLGGETGKNFRALLMSVLSSWISEFDTGAKITVEMTGVGRKLFYNLIGKLRVANAVNSVNVREFDADNISTIEVESRLEPLVLSQLIENLAPRRLQTNRVTVDYIQMNLNPNYVFITWRTFAIIAFVLAVILAIILYLIRKRSSKTVISN